MDVIVNYSLSEYRKSEGIILTYVFSILNVSQNKRKMLKEN